MVGRLALEKRGLVVVTGPTGSGKTTTLAAMVHARNLARPDHVITLEDPLEFLHEDVQCLIHQREMGRHALSFAEGLRAALREEPDVLLVGEMRDQETIGLALTAAVSDRARGPGPGPHCPRHHRGSPDGGVPAPG